MITRPAPPPVRCGTGAERRLKRFRHPSAGPLTLHSTSLLVADDPTTRIVVLHPATPSDAAALERLAS